MTFVILFLVVYTAFLMAMPDETLLHPSPPTVPPRARQKAQQPASLPLPIVRACHIAVEVD